FRAGARRYGYETLNEAERRRWLLEELELPRPLRSSHLVYGAETTAALKIFDCAAELQDRYGPAALPTYIISNASQASDLLEVALLLKEAGLAQTGTTASLGMNIVPLFESIGGLRPCATLIDDIFSVPIFRHVVAR